MILKRIFSVLALSTLGLTVAVPVAMVVPTSAYAADTVRPAVGAPLQAAQGFMKDHKFKEALQKIDEAEKVGSLTDYETYVIAQMRGSAAASAGDQATAIKAFEVVLASSRTPPATQLQLSQAVAQMYYQAKNYQKSAEWIAKYKQLGGSDPGMQTLLAQSYYLAGDYGRATTEIQSMVKNEEAAGRVPSEQELQLLASAALNQKNQDGYISALEMLVRYHPQDKYWADLIQRVAVKPGFSDRLSLDLYRVHLATNTMSTAGDYMEMAQLSLQAGYPGEAKTVLAKGFQAGKLGVGEASEQDRQKRLRDLIDKQTSDDQKSLPASEKDAVSAATGDALVNTGYDYVAYGQFAKGLALMEQGIAKGSLKHADDSQLHLAEAYYAAGQKPKALDTLKLVKGTDGTSDLARLWTLIIKSGS